MYHNLRDGSTGMKSPMDAKDEREHGWHEGSAYQMFTAFLVISTEPILHFHVDY
jgi:hypothetical protein